MAPSIINVLKIKLSNNSNYFLGDISRTKFEGYKILYGIPKGKSKVVEIARLNTAGEIYAYTTGKENLIDAIGEYDRAKEYMSENVPEPQPEQSPNVISLQEATSNAAKAGMTLDQYKNWLKTTRNTEVR